MNTIEYWNQFDLPPQAVAPAQADWVGHDFFCGFGGFTLAAHWVKGVRLSVIDAVNHNPLCIRVHQRNHHDTTHHCVDMTNPRQFEPGYLPRADFALFSPECRYHGNATGVAALRDWVEPEGQLSLFEDDEVTLVERNRRWEAMSERERERALWQAERSRLTMGQVVRMVAYHKYQWFIVENVVEVHRWRHFNQWLHELEGLGYRVVPLCLNSQFFGVPQSRDRVFFFCYRANLPDPDLNWCPWSWCPTCEEEVAGQQTWKQPQPHYGKYRAQYYYACPVCLGRVRPFVRGADSIIDWTLPMPTVGERKDAVFCRRHRVRPLRPKTRDRVAAGLKDMARRESGGSPFISVLRSGRPRNQGIDGPLATFTSINNHAVVSPFVVTLRGGKAQHSLNQSPLSTITTVNHHSLVAPQILTYHGRASVRPVSWPTTTQTTRERHALIWPDGRAVNLGDPQQLEVAIDACGFRMLSWQEARAGMGFPNSYRLASTKKANFFGLGQAVAPPCIPWMIERAVTAWGKG